jgi:deoxycytidylate deaminase
MRPDWDEYFLAFLPIIAKRATCDRGTHERQDNGY